MADKGKTLDTLNPEELLELLRKTTLLSLLGGVSAGDICEAVARGQSAHMGGVPEDVCRRTLGLCALAPSARAGAPVSTI